MLLHKILEYPVVYNLCQKILSFIAFGNEGMANFLQEEFKDKHDRILDVGCGTGRFAHIFGERYTGIDHNPQYIEHAQAKYKGRFLISDAVSLDFLNEKFDSVLSICTFHHLSNDQAIQAVQEMKKVSNGVVYIIDPVYPSRFNFLGYMLFKMDRGLYRRTFKEMSDLLVPLGFKLVKDYLPNSFPYRICVFKHSITNT